MTDEDRAAAEELALEFKSPFEACKFLRGQIGFTLREAAMLTNRLIRDNPTSALACGAQSYTAWNFSM